MEKKMEIYNKEKKEKEQKDISKRIKYLSSPFVFLLTYLLGVVCYEGPHISYPAEYNILYNRKKELNRKIDEWARFIPTMREPFASQYKDSLESAVKDTSKINLRVNEIKRQKKEEEVSGWYSWAAFFMKGKK